MIIKTLFENDGCLKPGEVEVKLLPGIPLLHVVGQPDSHIRECGIKLKSALRSCDLQWPKGHQIVVNLRPSHYRKSSSGADLAIALGFLALTNQLSESVKSRIAGGVVYGEVALDGKVFAPPDLAAALRAAGSALITGPVAESFRDGSWLEMESLQSESFVQVTHDFDWESYWREPELLDFEVHPEAAESLLLAAHMKLNVLVAGPQGSGKTTWAKLLYGLSPKPVVQELAESRALFGDEVLQSRWRPCENPHHSIPTLSMIGGGVPLVPGVISRAHGGMLIMDEFLRFRGEVLEALREPVESGYIEHVRRGEKARFPAQFQLIGTTNLCPCGKMSPDLKNKGRCACDLQRLRSVIGRLSGPVMDRFDLLLFSHGWLKVSQGVRVVKVKQRLRELAEFRAQRGIRGGGATANECLPMWMQELQLGHRRRNAVLRLARGFADLDESLRIQQHHFEKALKRAVDPMEDLRQILA